MGDYNRPLSLNRWMYVEGNPVNYMDPTGLHPGESHSKYCTPLSGKDYQYCNNIVRGIHPDTQMSRAQYFLYDLFDESCDILNLHESLPHSLYMGTWKQYGWWWHYLLDQTPGWWNNQGSDHIKFGDVVSFALAAELSTAVDTYPKIVGYAAGAFANKGWDDGFYKMIGSRQSVYWRINNAVYGGSSPDPGTPYNFAEFASKFQEIYSIAHNAQKIKAWGGNILSKTGFTPEQRLAYEWGNPTNLSPQKFKDALWVGNQGVGSQNVLYLTGSYDSRDFYWSGGLKIYRLAFVVSQQQMNNLCGNDSCVNPQH